MAGSATAADESAQQIEVFRSECLDVLLEGREREATDRHFGSASLLRWFGAKDEADASCLVTFRDYETNGQDARRAERNKRKALARQASEDVTRLVADLMDDEGFKLCFDRSAADQPDIMVARDNPDDGMVAVNGWVVPDSAILALLSYRGRKDASLFDTCFGGTS